MQELDTAKSNIDTYIIIFEKLIYNNKTMTPVNAFDFYFKKKYDILNIIIVYDRLDCIQKLYDADIRVHKYQHIVYNIIKLSPNTSWIDLLINNGWDYSAHIYLLDENNYTNQNVTYIVAKFIINKLFVSGILKLAIRSLNKIIIGEIINKINYSIEELNDIVFDTLNSSACTIDDDMTELLAEFGIDICSIKNKLFWSMVEQSEFSNQMKYLFSLGINNIK